MKSGKPMPPMETFGLSEHCAGFIKTPVGVYLVRMAETVLADAHKILESSTSPSQITLAQSQARLARYFTTWLNDAIISAADEGVEMDGLLGTLEPRQERKK